MDSCIRLLPDYARLPNNKMALEKVGIIGVKQYQLDFSEQRTITTQAAYVDLSGENGIHMSRLSIVLKEYTGETICINSELLEKLLESHDASSAYWECDWEQAHQMENEQEIFIKCKLEGVITHDTEDWFLTMEIPYASVCPCAAAMCESEEDGIPHMQRARARITGQLNPEDDLDDLLTTMVSRVIDVVDLVPVMKRPDELDWCKRASQTNLFVEDASRVIGDVIDGFMEDWVVVCTHYESIHQHDVVSVCRKGKKLV
jgi:GTP cyclohydrolase I